jgi:hypothetical protein
MDFSDGKSILINIKCIEILKFDSLVPSSQLRRSPRLAAKVLPSYLEEQSPKFTVKKRSQSKQRKTTKALKFDEVIRAAETLNSEDRRKLVEHLNQEQQDAPPFEVKIKM